MRKILLSFTLFFCIPFIFLSGQNPSDYTISKKLFIKNAKVPENIGKAQGNYSILIVDGVIADIGANISAPSDAIVLDADSLFAYPAFVDPCSHTAIPKPEKEERPSKVDNPDKPGYARAGISPQKEVQSELSLSDKSVKAMRKAGFAISHSVPRGGMLAGQGSIILLKEKEDPFIYKNNSLYASLSSARGRVYPSTTIAVMAKYRDLVNQARNGLKHENDYKLNPVGLKRPNYALEIQALYPSVSKKQKVFMHAEKTLDISRASKLNEDLMFDMILVETKQAWPNIKTIQDKRISLLLSMDIPKSMKEVAKDSTAVADPSKDALIAKKKKSILEYQNQAKFMSMNNVNYSFSYLDVKAKDIHGNALQIAKNGLDKKKILNAMTIDAARIIGVDRIAGSLDKGKLGNVLLTTKDYFDKDMQISHMVVEGELFKYEIEDKKKKSKDKASGESPEIAGEWSVRAVIPGDEQTGTLTIKNEDGEFSGKIVDQEGETLELDDIELSGNTLTFSFTSEDGGESLTMDANVELDDDSFEGTLSLGAYGSFPFTGTKSKNPK